MKFSARPYAWKLVGCLAACGLLFSLTNTGSVPSFLLVVGFVLLGAAFYYLLYGLLAFARLYGMSIRRKRRLAGVLTAMAAGLMALQSIGELNSLDAAVLLPLVVIGYTYSFYGKAGRPASDA
jgi:hypothetical protein